MLDATCASGRYWTAMPEENVEVVRSMLGAFNRDDVDAVIAAFDEGCEIREPLEMPDSPAMGYRGHDGIREWMRNLRGVARAGFELRRFTSSGDVLLCELASRGLGQASAVPIEWMTFAVFEMRRGKIGRIRVFLSREEALEAMGLRE
ncbi:MAG: nuclear transport factor 2 family protein [Thermoleophilaceae bacterium]